MSKRTVNSGDRLLFSEFCV